jgi:opacity protein-like surface antigen
MKKILLSILLPATLSLSAQNAADSGSASLKPQQGNVGITLHLTGLINNLRLDAPADPAGNLLLQGRYYVRNAHVVTLGIGMHTRKLKMSTVDSVGSGQAKYDSTFKQNNFYLSPGYEYHFLENKRLDPYIGGALHFGFLGKKTASSINEFVDTTGTATVTTDYKYAGGFQFGLTAVAGFNFFIAKNFALGAEYRFGFLNLRDGGDFEVVSTSKPVAGNTVSKRSVGSLRMLDSGLFMQSGAAITLSYFFGRKDDRYLPD